MSREYSKIFPKLGDRTKRNLHSVINEIREYISLFIQPYSNNIIVIDNMSILVCEFGRAYFRKCFKGEASYEICLSKNEPILHLSFMNLLE